MQILNYINIKMKNINSPIFNYLFQKPFSWVGSFSVIVYMIFQMGCTKLVDVPAPPSSLSSGNVYSSDGTAASALTGIYTNLSNNNSLSFASGDFTSLSLFGSLSADELTLYDLTNQT